MLRRHRVARVGAKLQAAAASRGKARQDVAGHRSHAGADVLPQAAEGLEREEDQRRAVRHGQFCRVSAARIVAGQACAVHARVHVAGMKDAHGEIAVSRSTRTALQTSLVE